MINRREDERIQLIHDLSPSVDRTEQGSWARRGLVQIGLLGSSVFIIIVIVALIKRGNVAADVHRVSPDPPELVVQPNFKSMHYCGLNPYQSAALPEIPLLNGEQQYQLIHVHAFIRHGDRFFDQNRQCWPGQETTIYSCNLTHLSVPSGNIENRELKASRLFSKKYIMNRNDFEGNCNVGQLSEKGYHQESTLGSIFRRAYIPMLLSETLKTEEIYLRSDDVPRTILSAESFVSGLYPIALHADKTHVNVVDIWTMDVDRETEVTNGHVCPGFIAMSHAAKLSPDYIAHSKQVTIPLHNRIASVFGVDADKLHPNAFDCLGVSLCRGDPAPSSVDQQLLEDIEQENVYSFYYPLQNPVRNDATRLSSGPLLREIDLRIESIISGEDKTKFFLYSGHDTGPIMLLLNAFHVEDRFWAPYASYVSLELYAAANGYHVRFVYNGEARRLIPCPDTDLCPWKLIKEYLQPMIPSQAECPDAFKI